VLRSASTGIALVLLTFIFALAGPFSGETIAGDPILPAKGALVLPAKGALVIVGGGLRFNNDDVWNRIVELAPAPEGQRPKIAVFPTASASPVTTGERIAETLKRYGAEAFVVPVAMQSMDQPYEQAVQNPQLVEAVKSSHGIFFAGGEQRRITTALYTKEGKHTPMLDAIWAVYRGGGVVAGTSAGAAVMSHVMCRDARKVLSTLHNGVTMGREVDRGLGFLDNEWFVDQHALVRGRFARALVIMKSQNLKYGVGVDENTALEVRANEQARVIGERGALVLDISEAKNDDKLTGFNLRGAKLTYLERGDAISLKNLTVTPAPEKQSGQKFPPPPRDLKVTTLAAPDTGPLWSNDILGNSTVADMLVRLIQGRKDEAIGLAFDGAAARQKSTPGFEFRFYRADDSAGWSTGAFGGETYTVTNIRLDVRPVEIVGPLYK
jgi:cyanophycinase